MSKLVSRFAVAPFAKSTTPASWVGTSTGVSSPFRGSLPMVRVSRGRDDLRVDVGRRQVADCLDRLVVEQCIGRHRFDAVFVCRRLRPFGVDVGTGDDVEGVEDVVGREADAPTHGPAVTTRY